MKKQLTTLLLLSFCSVASLAFEGRVVAVLDGDTITVLDARNKTHKIRLAEIDAPEKAQPFGQRAKQKMSELCFGSQASVSETGTDRYGRLIAKVSCNGQDANWTMVAEGFAWVYRQYASSPALFQAEMNARKAKRGLWAEASQTPPWEWRRASK